MMRLLLYSILLSGLLAAHADAQAPRQPYTITASSYLGGAGDDAVTGAVVLTDGTIVLAANLTAPRPGNLQPVLLGGSRPASAGAILRLAPDGSRILSVTRLSDSVHDLASDDQDNLYVAAGPAGMFKLNAAASQVLWHRPLGHVHRVDASPDGFSVALRPGNLRSADTTPGAGQITVFAPDGRQLGQFAGHRHTLDIAIDSRSQTVCMIGWRQDNAWDGSRTFPVQIAYIRGSSYTGETKWTGYDWSTNRNADNFINRPQNNMADTRGYRCAIGRDGMLYVAYEVAGGNHIFRYSPFNVTQRVSIVGGDRHFNFSNTRAEHKTFFARHNPATGEYLLGQEFTNRNERGAGNTVRMTRGAIAADAAGRVYIGGSSASGLPMTFNPQPADAYTGGGWLMVVSPDFRQRLYVTRLSPGTHSHAIGIRQQRDGWTSLVFGGSISLPQNYPAHRAVQPEPGGGERDGWFGVIDGRGGR